MDARKERLGEREALALAAAADDLYSVKGKKVTHLALKDDKPDRATVLAAMLGPTGNLRAPGSYATGESPVQVSNPDGIRGISISTYGIPVLVNSRASF